MSLACLPVSSLITCGRERGDGGSEEEKRERRGREGERRRARERGWVDTVRWKERERDGVECPKLVRNVERGRERDGDGSHGEREQVAERKREIAQEGGI